MVEFLRKRKKVASFTLVELLVSMAVFAILLVLMAAFLSQATRLWRSNVEEAQGFQSARFAFQGMTQKLSQATLNTYWDFTNAASQTPAQFYQVTPSGTFTPTGYARESELQFTTGLATNLLAGTAAAPNVSTDAVFFLAPLGLTADTSKKSLVGLLNAAGYYVSFGQLPHSSLISSPAPYRYALWEFFQPSENLQIYSELYQSFNTGWFTNYFSSPAPANPPYHVYSPDVIALILRPDDGTYNASLAPSYFYDSRSGSSSPTAGSYTTPATTSTTFNQLPPVLHVTMVAIDESSAARLAQQYGATAPPLVPSTAFLAETSYTNDLTALGVSLVQKHINYHIFNADVPIRSAKWSP